MENKLALDPLKKEKKVILKSESTQKHFFLLMELNKSL